MPYRTTSALILIVEDEPSVGMIVSRLVRDIAPLTRISTFANPIQALSEARWRARRC
jgi:response regulator of citrate/malate metabolism